MKKYYNNDSLTFNEKVTKKNWNLPKTNRYAFCNFDEFSFTRTVYKGAKSADNLEYSEKINLENVNITDFEGNTKSASKYFEETNTDGLLIYKDDKILYEEYFGYYSEYQKHIMMSASKSITGFLLVNAIEEGLANFTDIIADHVPKLKGSAFDKVTIRQALDMQMNLAFSENYANLNAEIWDYSKAMSFMEKEEGYSGPQTVREALCTIALENDNKGFLYTSPITDVCSWVLTSLYNKNLTEIFQEKIYQKIGMENDAFYAIDSEGTELASAGLCITLRDALKLGKLALNKGKYNGEQIVPEHIFSQLYDEAGKQYIDAYSTSLQSKQVGKETWYYKNQVWVMNTADEDYAFIGVYGQVIYVNPKKRIVVVKQGSADDASTTNLGYQINIIQQIISKI